VSGNAGVAVASPRTLRPVGLCTRWLLVLLLRGQSNDAIHAALVADDLPCPTDAELDHLRTEHVPKPFRPTSAKHKSLLVKLGIAPFFQNTPEAEQALVLLREPRARELVEAGLIVGVPQTAIEQTLPALGQLALSSAAIELYEKIFFDVSAFTRAQLRVLVHARVRTAVMRMASHPEDEPAARRAIDSDARSVAMALPASPLAWSAVLMALGHAPSKFDLARVVRQMESLAVQRVSDALLRGGADDDRRAVGYIGVLEKISTIRAAVVPPDAALLNKMSVLRLRHDTQTLPTVGDLRAAGNEVTVDMGPPLESCVDNEVDE
jgi:hypothetical protein